MRDIIEQKCLLCGEGARFYFVDYENRKYFDCSRCKRYQVSVGAEEYLAEVGREFLLDISKFSSECTDEEAAVILLSSASAKNHPIEKISIVRANKSDLML